MDVIFPILSNVALESGVGGGNVTAELVVACCAMRFADSKSPREKLKVVVFMVE
jgi:hypothetical protein